MEVSSKLWALFRSPFNKDPSRMGSTFGAFSLWKPPYQGLQDFPSGLVGALIYPYGVSDQPGSRAPNVVQELAVVLMAAVP